MFNFVVMIILAFVPAPMLSSTLHAFVPNCPTEDSVGCFWDASTRGNGHGHSFVTLTDGTVIRLGSAS